MQCCAVWEHLMDVILYPAWQKSSPARKITLGDLFLNAYPPRILLVSSLYLFSILGFYAPSTLLLIVCPFSGLIEHLIQVCTFFMLCCTPTKLSLSVKYFSFTKISKIYFMSYLDFDLFVKSSSINIKQQLNKGLYLRCKHNLRTNMGRGRVVRHCGYSRYYLNQGTKKQYTVAAKEGRPPVLG